VRPARIPDRLRTGAFHGSAAVRAGLLTRRQLDGAAWRRLFRDVYVNSEVAVTHRLRAVAAAALVVPGAVVTGRSAAVLWDLDLAGPEDDVELTVPPTAHPVRVPGLRVRRARLPEDQICWRRGVCTTTAEATALQLATVLSGDEAVVAVDVMTASTVADLTTVRALAAAARGRGAARAREAIRLADGRAGSPQETRLRLLMARSGLPAPVAQYVVRDASGFVARVDSAWPELRLAVEYDGAWHAEPGRFAKDRRRLNRLQAAGWRVVFVTAADLYHPAQVVARIAAALAT
jgi:hypothetical protein